MRRVVGGKGVELVMRKLVLVECVMRVLEVIEVG